MPENDVKIPKAPSGLQARGRQLWRELHAEYDFEGAPEKLILVEEACRTADVAARLQAVVDAAEDLRVRGFWRSPCSGSG